MTVDQIPRFLFINCDLGQFIYHLRLCLLKCNNTYLMGLLREIDEKDYEVPHLVSGMQWMFIRC